MEDPTTHGEKAAARDPRTRVVVAWLLVGAIALGCGDSSRGPEPRRYDIVGNYLLSYDVIPGEGAFPAECDFGALGYAERERLTRDVKGAVARPLERVLGLRTGALETLVAPGGFEGEIAPSLQTNVVGVSMSPATARGVAASLGFVLRQSAVLVSDGTTDRGDTGYAAVSFEGRLGSALAGSFFAHAAAVEPVLGGGFTAFGDTMLFLNLSALPDREFLNAVDESVRRWSGVLARVSARREQAITASFVENDWRRLPSGSAYLDEVEAVFGDSVTTELTALQAQHARLAGRAAGCVGLEVVLSRLEAGLPRP